jgi:hypothetical protein
VVPTEVEEVSGRVLDEVGERGETLDGHLRGGDGGRYFRFFAGGKVSSSAQSGQVSRV